MSYTVISTNIRFDNPKDGKHDWNGRREVLTDLLKTYRPDIIGTQEGREEQLKDFASLFPCLELIDQHREWIEQRMYPCILINPKRVEVYKSGDIWLSETPNIPGSKSFDSAFPRLCTWLKGKFIDSNKEFIFINTHLDHVLETTRSKQIEVLIKEIAKVNDTNLPIILTGDFNEDPSGEVREKLINSNFNIYDPWKELGLDEEHSFHKFDGKNEKSHRIDWCLLDNSFTSNETLLEKRSVEGIYPSDHFPVITKFS